eukprot:13400808-Alexandrium_andersonii.AAC.1
MTALTSPSRTLKPACPARADSRAGVSPRTARWASSRSHPTEKRPPDSQRLARLHQAQSPAGLNPEIKRLPVLAAPTPVAQH